MKAAACMIVVGLFAGSCSHDDAEDSEVHPGVLGDEYVPAPKQPKSEEFFDLYAGLLYPLLKDGTRARFRMYERIVITDIVGRSLRETCVEELLPEGTQDKPVWFGREVGVHFGLADQLEKTMEDSNGNPFVLQLHDGKVRVVGAGPDGKMGTKDDDVYPAWLKGESWVFDKRPRQPER